MFFRTFFRKNVYLCIAKKVRGVAQLVSAPRSGRGGRKFESSHPDLRVKAITAMRSGCFFWYAQAGNEGASKFSGTNMTNMVYFAVFYHSR